MIDTLPHGVDGDQLHLARRQRRLSMRRLAEAAGRDPWHLYKVEQGQRALSVPVYVDMCRALDIPVGAPLTYSGPDKFNATPPSGQSAQRGT
jgi:transcriptional regulator with XRE-family HTH domain